MARNVIIRSHKNITKKTEVGKKYFSKKVKQNLNDSLLGLWTDLCIIGKIMKNNP